MTDKKILGMLKVFGVFSSKASEEIAIEEAERFAKRNAIVVNFMRAEPRVHCCEKCLAAHLLKVCSKMELLKRKRANVNKNLEVGHNGYYIDDDELVIVGK